MKSTDILTEFTVGSRLFNLHTESSDTDKIVVYVDYESRLFPNAKLNYLEVDEQSNSEISYTELGEFIKGLLLRPALKEVEMVAAIYNDNDLEMGEEVESLMMELYRNLIQRPATLRDMYAREINRRYNKLWHREHNLTGKNYNKDVELDVKYAAHLYRVLYSAWEYLNFGGVRTDFSPIRYIYLEMKEGKLTKDEIKDTIDGMKSVVDDAIELHAKKFPQDVFSEEAHKEQAKYLYWSFVKENIL